MTKHKELPPKGHFFVVDHVDYWPENRPEGMTADEWCDPIKADTPEEAVREWAEATEKQGGFSGDPYPDCAAMLVRDSDGAEWRIMLSTEIETYFVAHDKEPADG